MHRALKSRGLAVSRRRVEGLMRAAGLRGRMTDLYRSNPRLHRFYDQHDNLLWKHRAKRPNRIWVADITYLRVAAQWRYLAVVMDQCSRRVLGWSLARSRGAGLTRTAFDLAARTRRPGGGLIFHSDRGSEYAGTGLSSRLRSFGVRQSMTRGGCPGGNAHAESLFHSLKADVIHGVRFKTDAQIRACLRWYVPFYNHRRSHSSIDFLFPVEYERRCA